MIELFSALALIPETICGLNQNPKATLTVLGVAFFIIIPVLIFMDESRPAEPTPVPVVVREVPQIKEEAPKERRIVRFAKWLWKKE